MTSADKDQIEERLTTGVLGQWYAVGKSVQVRRDKPHAIKALGRNLVLWRDTHGKLHCLEDYCPHRGARLSRGEVNVGQYLLPLSRRHARRIGHDRARAGDAGLRAGGPQGR